MSLVNNLDILSLIQIHGYWIMFVLMFIEGPITAYVAAFAASLGYFNVWAVLSLFVFGNQIPDTILFFIGRGLRGKSVESVFKYFGVKKRRIVWIEKNMKNNFFKTTMITKLVPPLPTPGIILTGFARIEFKKFFWTYFIYNIVYASIFVLLGYYSGIALSIFLKYLKLTQYLLFIGLCLSVLLYYLIKFISNKISKTS